MILCYNVVNILKTSTLNFAEEAKIMKVAIVGSRGLQVEDFAPYLPENTTEIVSGGAKGIDTYAAEYARTHSLALTEFKPDYRRFGRGAPLKRNVEIVDYADLVLVFWDGASRGSRFVIDACRRAGKNCIVIEIPPMR